MLRYATSTGEVTVAVADVGVYSNGHTLDHEGRIVQCHTAGASWRSWTGTGRSPPSPALPAALASA